MHNTDLNDIERKLHDGVFIQSIDRMERLGKFVSENFHIPANSIRDEKVLADILVQLERENNTSIGNFQEDVGVFLAEWLDGEEEESKPVLRSGTKNNFFNRTKAKTYIDTYWKNYNPAYPTFHGGGGDCANFVSQVLFAGGMPWVDDGNPNHYTWFTNWYCKPGATNKDGDKRVSLSWKVAASFKKQWEKRAARQIIISYKDAISNMKQLSREVFIGDPVQFCYSNGVPYHTLVVTGYSWDKAAGVNDIVLASHTIDSNKRSLYNTMLKYPQDYQLRVYVIKESE